MSRSSFCASSLLRKQLTPLLQQGACLLFPGPSMPVPIPLNECVLHGEHRLLWATCHTPYGPVRPCVGVVTFQDWSPSPDGDCTFYDQAGHVVALIRPTEHLGLPTGRSSKLLREQSDHRERASSDPSYASRWAKSFREASQATPPTG